MRIGLVAAGFTILCLMASGVFSFFDKAWFSGVAYFTGALACCFCYFYGWMDSQLAVVKKLGEIFNGKAKE